MSRNYKTFVRLRLDENEIERLDENTVELALPVCEVPSLIPAELEEAGLREGVIIEIMGGIQNEFTLEYLRSRFIPPN